MPMTPGAAARNGMAGARRRAVGEKPQSVIVSRPPKWCKDFACTSAVALPYMDVFAQVVTTWDSKASDRNADACSNLEPRLREVVCILAPWFGAHAFVPCISVQVVAQRQDLISELLQKLRQEAAEANDGSQ